MECNGLEQHKTIFDCVHGYIDLTEVEKEVVDTCVFQRLHNIKQLGTAYFVYPTAQHTRFSHSLGVLHLVSLFIDAILREDSSTSLFDDKKKIQEVRLAALLHDIGHHPFSHIIDEAIIEHDGKAAKHTVFARHVIESTKIATKIKNYDTKSISSMITGKHTVGAYNSLISSGLDADRLDYLGRDSHFTGVAYGAVDIPRIMKIVRLFDYDIAFDLKGLPTIENYIMALMSMYWAVYYHKTITGFGLILKKIYDGLREEELVPSYDELVDCDETEFYGYNDAYMYNIIRQKSRDRSKRGVMCGWFLDRQRLKLVESDRVYGKSEKGADVPTRLSDLMKKSKLESIACEAEMDVDDIYLARHNRDFLNISADLISLYDSDDDRLIPIQDIKSSALSDFVRKAYIEDRIYTTEFHIGRENGPSDT